MFAPTASDNYKIANSYLSLEDANDILRGQKDFNYWNELAQEAKEALLINSSFAIDGAISHKGKKTDEEQLLKYPRDGEEDVQLAIKIATAILALKVAKNKDDVKSETIGKLSKVYRDSAKESDILIYLNPFKARVVKIFQ